MRTGAELHDEINKKIVGRLALITHDESDLLYKFAGLDSDYLEIGCLWGGTAILAARAKINNGVHGHVYSIDKMEGGYWENGDPVADHKIPTLKKVQENLKRFGVDKRVTIMVQNSHPLDLPEGLMPRVVLIDGAHSYEGCKTDWLNVRKLAPDYVMFHDYASPRHPGVQKVVDEIIESDSEWVEVARADTLIVLGKVQA